jgi:hypothetical protein
MYAGSVRILVFVRILFHKKNFCFLSLSLFFSFLRFFSKRSDDVHRINYACISPLNIKEKTTKKEIEENATIDKKRSLDSLTI